MIITAVNIYIVNSVLYELDSDECQYILIRPNEQSTTLAKKRRRKKEEQWILDNIWS